MNDDRRRTFWQVPEHNQRMASSYQQPGQESEKEEEDSAMAALMRSTDEDIEINCKLVRDVIESQREQKRETVLKFEKLF